VGRAFSSEQRQPIAAAVEGMRVLDRDGTEVGTVEQVKLGDPGAVTTQGQRAGEVSGLIGFVVNSVAGSEPDLPGTLAARLLRLGYIKIDGGLFGPDRYAAADEIAEAGDGLVRLRVPAGQLPTETG
jgi:hypothetical protein